jgi:tRNA threonylcarbamoyladenosine biosynthesis protein TsaE
MSKFILGIENLPELTKEVTQLLPNGGVVILRGDLAAGKTTFVAAFAKEFGLDDAVTSPTFSLQQCYGENIFHYDIYNHGIEHFIALGMLEELERDGYHFVEWGDDTLSSILFSAEIPAIIISIEKLDDKRLYKVENAYIKS